MTKFNLDVTFDGINDVERLPGQSVFEGGPFMGYYNVFASDPDEIEGTVSFTGSGWRLKALRLTGDNSQTVFTDLDNGEDRRIDFFELGYNSDVDLISTRARYIFGWDGEEHIVKLGNQQDGSTASINLYATQNTVVTGNAYVQTINTGGEGDGAKDKITIGDGGAGSLFTGNGNDFVSTKGWVEFASTGSGNDKVNIGSEGAGAIRTKDGKDTVITKDGWVELISTGNDNDKVKLGEGFASTVNLSGGNDKLFIVDALNSDYGVTAWGGDGTDMINFAKFSMGVTYSLWASGWQNVGASNGETENIAGWVRTHRFENVVGSKKADNLTGNGEDNVIKGGKGNDTLAGMGGDDKIIGSAGNDTFVFGANSGTDLVKGFQQGSDTLRIEDHSGNFHSLDISKDGKDLVIEHDGGSIILAGDGGLKLTADDFDFI